MSALPILVAEDDAALREALADTLRFAGFDVTAVADGSAALAEIERRVPALVLSDVQMSPMDGHELLSRVRSRWSQLPVVLVTAHGTIERAVGAMRDGAADYLVKPFEANALIELAKRIARVPERPDTDADAPVAVDPRSRETLELARRIAASDVTVLITGESGTGKEVYARYLHARSARAAGPFVAINCAAIPENMLEAMLFGHEKGAFTGAVAAHAGKFEQASGGTLLLDELSEMSLPLQAKLLRVLQERELERLGGHKTIKLDVRVLATSNRNLPAEVAAGRFREDLYYRLNVMPLRMPALRERPLDVVPLAERMLVRLARGTVPLTLSPAAAERLQAHAWPGNVRELDNVMQRACVLATGTTLGAQDIVFETGETPTGIPGAAPGGAGAILGAGAAGTTGGLAGVGAVGAGSTAASTSAGSSVATPAEFGGDLGAPLENGLRDRERTLILEALAATDGSRKLAAERLGISPRTLRYKLAQFRADGVEVP